MTLLHQTKCRTLHLQLLFAALDTQRSIRMAPRIIRFHVVRKETRRTLLYRVHRCLLNTAFIVCLMRHTAVQTSVA